MLSPLDASDEKSARLLAPGRRIAALEASVPLRLPGLDVRDGDLVLPSPFSRRFAVVSGTIVNPDRAGLSPPFNDAIKAADHAIGRQREINRDRQSFSVEVIRHIHEPKSTPVAKANLQDIHGIAATRNETT